MVDVPTKQDYDIFSQDVIHRLGVLEAATTPVLSFFDTFSVPYNLTDGAISPDGKWRLKYLSGGKTFCDGQVLTMYPKTATGSAYPTPYYETYSTLILSTQKFKDFTWDVDMKTNKQLRLNNPPATWETGWLMWSYTDEAEGTLGRSDHHYYFVLKTNGWEFGKKDNAPGNTTNEQQIFIKTGTTPICRMGLSNHITIIKKGFHFTIKVNGVTIVDMDDPKVNDTTKMAEGFVGLYEEDSSVSWDNIKII
jgi:hypothetical protein